VEWSRGTLEEAGELADSCLACRILGLLHRSLMAGPELAIASSVCAPRVHAAA